MYLATDAIQSNHKVYKRILPAMKLNYLFEKQKHKHAIDPYWKSNYIWFYHKYTVRNISISIRFNNAQYSRIQQMIKHN